MARMIPSQIDVAVPSSAEKRIFRLLETDPSTKGWTVLHSLGLARKASGPYGEIDFVVIIPGEGIICLEVKGGRVSCDDGMWRTINRSGDTSVLKKSPFMQARESMFALRQLMINHFGLGAPESACPIAFAVVFPDIECPPATPEFERSDAIDNQDLRRPISASINRVIESRLGTFQHRGGERYPTPAHVRSILQYLRPSFDLVVAKSVNLARTEARLLSLTEEQYDRLDQLEENPRCLFEGAAGTGKTLLALEYARRAKRKGARVLFVCFNRLLGDWLQRQTESTGITTATWHEFLKGVIANSSVAEEFVTQEREALENGNLVSLFEEVYPLYGELALEELGPLFEVLVMDEAQDLFDRPTLDLINRTIDGGLAGGTWGIFGDFTRQAIYGSSSGSMTQLSEYSQHFVKAKLTLNCRNTRRIAQETAIFGGFDNAPYKLGRETGLPVEHRYWKTASSLLKTLTRTIQRLMDDGVPVEDVTILSSRRLEKSSLFAVEQICDVPLLDCSRSLDPARRCIRFSTIHSFKGLESKVVIMVDIDDVDDDRSQSLLYVGMSRARSLLILLFHERTRRSIDARVRSALERELRT